MVKRGLGLLFLSATLAASLHSQSRSVAVTVDDMPAVIHGSGTRGTHEAAEINRKLLAGFQRHHVPAAGFVNQQGVEADGQANPREAILESWLKAGLTLGNHTFSHLKFSSVSLDEFEKNTSDGERTLAPLLARHGKRLRFFRYPYNDTGGSREKKSGFEEFLAARGYEIATCTMEDSDWMFDRVYVNALMAGDSRLAAEVRSAYMEFAGRAADGYSKMAREVIGRDFPQVLVIHANHLNADSIDDLLKVFEARGYKFVSLEDAQADPAYRAPESYVGPHGLMWQQRWALAAGRKTDPRDAPDPPQWIQDEYGKLSKIGY